MTANNERNQFKVKLNPSLMLPGTGWKVSIAYAVLRKMSFKDLQSESVNLIELWYEAEKSGQSDVWKKGYFSAADLRRWEKAGACHEGVDFFNNLKHEIEERAHASLDAGFKFSQARWSALKWNKDSVQSEVVLNHSHTDNLIYIFKPFAEKLRWMNAQTNQADIMGPNLVHSYPNHTKGTSSLDTGKPTKILGNWLHLSTLSNWRFINLNQSFREALNLHSRPLEVTSKVTANKQTTSQRLNQVYCAPQGRQWYIFTSLPPSQQYHFEEVQDPHWEEIEITLKELDGGLVKFQSDSQCVIKLQFRQG